MDQQDILSMRCLSISLVAFSLNALKSLIENRQNLSDRYAGVSHGMRTC